MLIPAQQVGHILSGTQTLPRHADLAKLSHQKNYNAHAANGTYPFRDTNPAPSRGLGEAAPPEK